MNNGLNNMDYVFRGKLKNYRQNPPVDVWEGIEQQLNAQKNIPGYSFYKIAASIAVLAVIASLYFYVNFSSNSEIQQTFTAYKIEQTQTENNFNEQLTIVETDVYENDLFQSDVYINKLADEHIEIIERTEEIDQINPYLVEIKQVNSHPELALKSEKKKRNIFANIFPEFYSQSQVEFSMPSKISRKIWVIGGEFSPSFSYRHIAQSDNSSDNSFFNSVESPVFSYSGGLNVQYKSRKRLTVQAGVYYSSMGQDMDYISVYANSVYELIDPKYRDRYINAYAISNSAGEVVFNSPHVIIDQKTTARVDNLSGTKTNYDIKNPMFANLDASIRQNFEYIVVPLILRYKLVDKMVDVNIVGGVGANFLIGNNVYLLYGNNKDVIGKTQGVNEINYSGSLGFGLEYPIFSNVRIHIEPSIKYFLNPINSNTEIESHPYSIGIFTGVNYSF